MRRLDVVALVAGLLLTGIAACSLWYTFAGSIDWQVVRVVAPLTLVIVGVLGLTLSRSRP